MDKSLFNIVFGLTIVLPFHIVLQPQLYNVENLDAARDEVHSQVVRVLLQSSTWMMRQADGRRRESALHLGQEM